MEIVLLKDVEKLGHQGNIVRVKAGFARNFLVPQGLAVIASEPQLKTVNEITRQRRRKLERIQADAEALKLRLEKHSLSFTLSLGEEEKAFGSITAHDIFEALSRDGFKLEKHAVSLAQPIKSLGAHEAAVKLHPSVTAVLKIRVVKA